MNSPFDMPQEGFMFDNPGKALLFFRYCRRYGIEGTKARVAALRKLVAKQKAAYLRDVQAATQGKRILKIKRKNSNV